MSGVEFDQVYLSFLKCKICFIYVGFSCKRKKVGWKNVWKLVPLRGEGGGRTPNGKCHLKFPFWFFDSFPKVSCWAMLIDINSLHLTRPPWGCSPWRCPHRPLLRWSFCPAYNCNLRGVLALELSLITSLAEQKRWEVQSIYQQPKWSHSFFWGLLIVYRSEYLSCT